MSYPNTFI